MQDSYNIEIWCQSFQSAPLSSILRKDETPVHSRSLQLCRRAYRAEILVQRGQIHKNLPGQRWNPRGTRIAAHAERVQYEQYGIASVESPADVLKQSRRVDLRKAKARVTLPPCFIPCSRSFTSPWPKPPSPILPEYTSSSRMAVPLKPRIMPSNDPVERKTRDDDSQRQMVSRLIVHEIKPTVQYTNNVEEPFTVRSRTGGGEWGRRGGETSTTATSRKPKPSQCDISTHAEQQNTQEARRYGDRSKQNE